MRHLLLAGLLPLVVFASLAALVQWAGGGPVLVAAVYLIAVAAFVIGRRARGVWRSAVPATLALVMLAVAAAPPALAADTTVSAGSLIGLSIEIILGVLGTPIAIAVTAFLLRLMKAAGVDIQDAYRARLEEMIANGLAAAADRLDKRLDGTLDVNVRSKLVAEAADYLAKHGRETVKALGGDPKDRDAMRAIVAARLGRLTA